MTSKPVADRPDALVVVGLRAVDDLARRPLGERALGEADVVVGVVERPERPAVVVVALAVGQVLLERPAARDVHQLHAPADAEQREVALERAARQRDLERVALRHRALRLRVGAGAVGAGVDVGPAREEQAVEEVEDVVGIGDQRLIRR